jgi:hypothetical protein
MGLDPSLQERLYTEHWRPMEEAFGQDAYSRHFDGFMRLLIGVNYSCRCASIILAGWPPVEDVVELHRSDSWERRTPG